MPSLSGFENYLNCFHWVATITFTCKTYTATHNTIEMSEKNEEYLHNKQLFPR